VEERFHELRAQRQRRREILKGFAGPGELGVRLPSGVEGVPRSGRIFSAIVASSTAPAGFPVISRARARLLRDSNQPGFNRIDTS
jgi:hypothetical protein